MSVGRIIAGKYCLLHQLGRGAMGSVWVAEHLTLRSQVAVKLIQQQMVGVRNVPHRFEREARALATLRSPHVVQVLDYGVDSGTQYLVMELLNGETLRARLARSGRLTAEEVFDVARQIARAMSVSHAAGFVHRDLKPENVFLTRDGDELIVKVLDFGITKALTTEAGNLTDAGMMLGTCYYMSPEQAKGGSVDSRSDLWSLGVIVFECLTGTLPFRGDSMFAVVSAICSAPLVIPSQVARVPTGFDAWFACAACRDPGQRFASAHEFAEALRPVLAAPQQWVGEEREQREGGSDDDTQRIEAFPSSFPNRRGEARIPSSIPAAIDGQRDFRNTALVYNASRNGALLTTQRSWEPEQALELRLHLDSPSEGELVSAQVVRISASHDPFWKFEVAVRFAQPLSQELLARIESKTNKRMHP